MPQPLQDTNRSPILYAGWRLASRAIASIQDESGFERKPSAVLVLFALLNSYCSHIETRIEDAFRTRYPNRREVFPSDAALVQLRTDQAGAAQLGEGL